MSVEREKKILGKTDSDYLNKETFASIFDEYKLPGKEIRTLCVTAVYDDETIKSGMIMVGSGEDPEEEMPELEKKLAAIFSDLDSIIRSMEEDTSIRIPEDNSPDDKKYVNKLQNVFNVIAELNIFNKSKSAEIETALIRIAILNYFEYGGAQEPIKPSFDKIIEQLLGSLELKKKDLFGAASMYMMKLLKELRSKYFEDITRIAVAGENKKFINGESSLSDFANCILKESSIVEDLYMHLSDRITYEECEYMVPALVCFCMDKALTEKIAGDQITFHKDLKDRKISFKRKNNN